LFTHRNTHTATKYEIMENVAKIMRLKCAVHRNYGCSDFANLMAGFRDDAVGEICQTDATIILTGQRLWDKGKTKVDKKQEVKKNIRSQMRILGRLLSECRTVIIDEEDPTDVPSTSSVKAPVKAP
jgi:hypothetical protein